ncbi:MAG TPA: protein phosphatase CheZ [Rhodocyclaceae bacterium]|nr:protein phosphatase CheZ [Rhodocyclaceae bacterium]
MTKKQRIDESGDSEDLQALFDSIASGAQAPRAEPAPVAVVADNGDGADGDDDALQALFDQIASEFDHGGGKPPAAATPVVHAAAVGDGAASAATTSENVFNRIGQMTRQVHDTLRALGRDDVLNEAVQAIPDARQRLNYIAVMTEQAASRVLNATDIAKPLQDSMLAGAGELEDKWDKLFANQLSVDEFKALAGQTRQFLGRVRTNGQATNEQLMEIMMAQDFQDLTGQVIKKVVDLAQTLETELLQILLEVTPADKRVQKAGGGLMNGPVVSTSGRDDIVTSQEQVDDLLDSLGF